MINPSQNAAMEELLDNLADKKGTKKEEKLLQTTYVSEKGQYVRSLPLIEVVELVWSHIYGDEAAILSRVAVIVLLDIEYLEEIHIGLLPKLEKAVLKFWLLRLHEEVRSTKFSDVKVEE